MKNMHHLEDSQLNEYLDGSLAADVRLEVGAHLEACADCLMRLREFQLVFDSLAGLPDVRISHDLTPGILKRLPQKISRLWTPVFALQSGVVLGILVWFSSEAARLINPPINVTPAFSGFAGFHLPPLTLSRLTSIFPAFNIQPWTINFMLTVPKFQPGYLSANAFHITLAHLQNWMDQFPAWRFQFTNPLSLLIGGSISLFWILGNAVLLRDHSEAGK